MSRYVALAGLAVLSLTTRPLAAQDPTLRSLLSQLFTFGNCGQPLCLDGSINAGNGHGNHFLSAAAGGNLAVISFISEAIGQSVAGTPISGTSSGATYSFVGGVPVRTSRSAGPIFAERSQTLGRGRLFFGSNVTGINFSTLGGIPIDNLTLNFTHEDVDNEGSLGDPQFENDLIQVRLGLDVNLMIATAFATYGLTDFIDVGIAVPFVRTSVRGSSEGQVHPFGPSAIHFFGGTPTDPVLRAATSVDGSKTGIGDVAGRIKFNVAQTSNFGAALLTDVRFPTGDEENLLGSGATAVRAVGILAGQFGSFSPHVNAGYLVRTDTLENDALLLTVGFDNLMSPWATAAVDLISEWQVGDNKITLPGSTQYDVPFVRIIQATPLVDRRQNRVSTSVGLKFTMREGTVLMGNAIIPITTAGLQSDVVWTAGLELTF
jgi:hypothetical protein